MKIRIACSLISFAAVLGADTLLLKNGSIVDGQFVGGDGRSIRFTVGNQVNTYNVFDIDSLRFGAASPSSSSSTPAPPPAAYFPSETRVGEPSASATPPPPAASSSAASYGAQNGPPSSSNTTSPNYPTPSAPVNVPNNIEVPSGTQVVVRLIDGADSKRDSLGQTYRASVEQPLVVNGQTVIPRGADAVAVLSDQQQSGKIEGKTMLTIALRSVSVNGHTYDLATSTVNKASSSRSTKSGEVIGGTAALGAIIGALAGGGRGAAIGAVSGAGVGTAAQIATSGERVKIPSETVLTFALQNPLYISSN